MRKLSPLNEYLVKNTSLHFRLILLALLLTATVLINREAHADGNADPLLRELAPTLPSDTHPVATAGKERLQ